MNKSGTVHNHSVPGAMTETADAWLDAIKVKLGDLEGCDTTKKRKNPCKGHRWYRSGREMKVPDENRWVTSFTMRDTTMKGNQLGAAKLIHHAYYYCKLCAAHELVPRIVGEIE